MASVATKIDTVSETQSLALVRNLLRLSFSQSEPATPHTRAHPIPKHQRPSTPAPRRGSRLHSTSIRRGQLQAVHGDEMAAVPAARPPFLCPELAHCSTPCSSPPARSPQLCGLDVQVVDSEGTELSNPNALGFIRWIESGVFDALSRVHRHPRQLWSIQSIAPHDPAHSIHLLTPARLPFRGTSRRPSSSSLPTRAAIASSRAGSSRLHGPATRMATTRHLSCSVNRSTHPTRSRRRSGRRPRLCATLRRSWSSS